MKLVRYSIPHWLPPPVGFTFRAREGEVRPAAIVRQWSETCANLQVFIDGANDLERVGPNDLPVPSCVWVTSAQKNHNADLTPGTWYE